MFEPDSVPWFVVYIYTSEKLHYILSCNHIAIDLQATDMFLCEGWRAHLELLEVFSWISPIYGRLSLCLVCVQL